MSTLIDQLIDNFQKTAIQETNKLTEDEKQRKGAITTALTEYAEKSVVAQFITEFLAGQDTTTLVNKYVTLAKSQERPFMVQFADYIFCVVLSVPIFNGFYANPALAEVRATILTVYSYIFGLRQYYSHGYANSITGIMEAIVLNTFNTFAKVKGNEGIEIPTQILSVDDILPQKLDKVDQAIGNVKASLLVLREVCRDISHYKLWNLLVPESGSAELYTNMVEQMQTLTNKNAAIAVANQIVSEMKRGKRILFPISIGMIPVDTVEANALPRNEINMKNIYLVNPLLKTSEIKNDDDLLVHNGISFRVVKKPIEWDFGLIQKTYLVMYCYNLLGQVECVKLTGIVLKAGSSIPGNIPGLKLSSKGGVELKYS